MKRHRCPTLPIEDAPMFMFGYANAGYYAALFGRSVKLTSDEKNKK